jgi:uncharacterized protein (TIGR03118 family)
MNKSARFSLVTTAIAVATLYAGAWRAEADFIQTNLVSDIMGLAAITDPNLKNPWGSSRSPTSPFWISNQGSATSTLYAVTANNAVSQQALVVSIPSIPQTPGGPQGPTGQVFNNTGSFQVGGVPATFIFANLNGTISAWRGAFGTTAAVAVPSVPNVVYTGLAIAQAPEPQLFAARAGGSTSSTAPS